MSSLPTYEQVYFEISGVCNAKCPFCVTGAGRLAKGGFVSVDLFKKSIDKLVAEKLIDEQSCISLYNWGEPFLHPDLKAILSYLNEKDINFALSSNASVYSELDTNNVKKLQEISFSMSGFSQSSYDRVHGFNFEKIKENIAKFIDNLQKVGYQQKIRIFFHIYQFNLDEIVLAKKFAKTLGVEFFPYFAFIADYEKAKDYLLDRLSSDAIKVLGESLVLADMAQKIKAMPLNFSCPQHEMLVIDENADILTCCFLAKDHLEYSSGNLFDDDWRESLAAKSNRKECHFCLQSGLSYCVHDITIPEFSKFLQVEEGC